MSPKFNEDNWFKKAFIKQPLKKLADSPRSFSDIRKRIDKNPGSMTEGQIR